VDVTLMYFDGCPNWKLTFDRLQVALRELGEDAGAVRLQHVSSAEQAELLSFRGSPSMLINGADPFAAAAAPFGLSCRMFQTPDGPAGAPTLEQLVQALSLGLED